ncbi:4-aminobutyrate--2-oxoglutarate transaminase [Sphingomonas cannabina]|uniref:4-aminobutyrate--2-oxoglutarate transaminase n=1 Tax=Sphingomonas cannabina TaxID=2899123 RepID=UPI001F157659|nr:4-aminobutyrate--2-oxoglutarate transaminase [Sphingomonas cannabina]UIJ45680.1 4-aminobutyrate--2-oxoglutarate transaminase [Sphingomonas cannabina]
MQSNAALHRRRLEAIPRGIANVTAIAADRAENAELWDVEGRRYIDFAAGIAVLNTGHRHPRVMAAVHAQLDRFTHTAFQVVAYEPYVALAERLNALAPIAGDAQTVLFSTGAEAVENAVKIARRATGRASVIAFTGAFHGRSLLTMALTGKVAPYKTGFGPMQGGIHHVPFPSGDITVAESLRALDLLFAASVDPKQVAAIIIEPVQGEGGFHPTPHELLRALRDICDRHGILLVADEVQTGFARTGKLFGIEHSGVEPDLITVAKGLAGGFPLAGVIGRKAVMDACDPGGLGTTFGGSPMACAAALAVLDVIEEERLCERAATIGAALSARIAGFAGRNDLTRVSAPRGLGAMVAFDILDDAGAPDPQAAKRVVARALDRGLIVLTCGPLGQAIRILAPLTIPDAQLAEGLDILEQALARETGE